MNEIKQCRLCNPGSFQKLPGHTLCSYCGALSLSHGHSLLHHYGQEVVGATDTTHCTQCPTFSGQDESQVGPDKLIMNNVEACVYFRGHERTDAGCSNCSEYMIQPLFSNSVCSYCSPGHFFVSRHVPCQLCDVAEDDYSSTGNRHVGLLLNSIDTNLTWGVRSLNEYDCVLGTPGPRKNAPPSHRLLRFCSVCRRNRLLHFRLLQYSVSSSLVLCLVLVWA